MFQKKQLHDICNLDHHTKLPCYDFCKICVNYNQTPATVHIVEEIVAWILFIKQISCKPCFLPLEQQTDNKCCKNECILVLAWKWTCKFTAKVLRDLVWCNCRSPESELRKSSWDSWGRLRSCSCRVWLSRIPRSSVWWCGTLHTLHSDV